MEEVLERDEAFYPDVFVFVSGELGGDSHSVRAIYGMGRDGISSSPHGSSQSPRSWRYRRERARCLKKRWPHTRPPFCC
jgi:hypothetical protein